MNMNSTETSGGSPDWEKHMRSGDKFFRQQSFDSAIIQYKLARSSHPAPENAEMAVGEAFAAAGDQKNALFHYEAALRFNPFFDPAFIKIQFMDTPKGSLDSLKAYFHNLEQGDSNDPWIQARLAELYAKLDEGEKAAAHNRRGAQLLAQRKIHNKFDSPPGEKRRGPDFIIVGPMKTATSALYKYLTRHPQVLPSIKKEIHYFNHPHLYRLGFEYYDSHFPDRLLGGRFLSGEASPGYFVNHVEDKIANQCPHTLVISLLRDPLKRALSHYNHNIEHGFEKRDINDAFSQELDFLEECGDLESAIKGWNWRTFPGYLLLGCYRYFLERWINAISPGKLIVVDNTALSERPSSILDQLFIRLGIEPYSTSEYERHFQGKYQSSPLLEQKLKSNCSDFFVEQNYELEELLNNVVYIQ